MRSEVISGSSTYRASRKAGQDVIGTECDAAIIDAVGRSAMVVAAWGGGGRLLGRPPGHGHGQRPSASRADREGSPRHPLFVSASQDLVPLPNA